MWSVVLKILSILGIILLCLLGFLLLVLLLVLFMPVVYRGGGNAHDGKYEAWFRFRWLFGLVRGEFAYPRSRGLRIKVLWLTVFDSGGKRKAEPEESRKTETAAAQQPLKEAAEEVVETAEKAAETAEETMEAAADAAEHRETAEQKTQEQAEQNSESMEEKSAEARKPEEKEQKSPVSRKNRLQHYLSVVQDQDNQDLVKHALSRLGKIIKSIRPRVLRAEAVVGLGEPDTTGYLYGVYWTIKPFLGKKCRVTITPDFEQRILEGKVSLRGHMIAAVLLYQAVRVLLDQRLRRLLGQLRN